MRSNTDMTSPRHLWGMREHFVLLVLLMLIPAGLARAQWPGLLPEPVNSADLMRYADRLEFSPAQWPAIEALHDEYKQRYLSFRDSLGTDLMQKLMVGQQSQSLDAMRDYIKELQSMRVTIAQHDRRFFDDLQGLLSETQIQTLPRVRMLRERQRYLGGASMMWGGMGANITDLSEIFYDLDLPESARRAADHHVAQFERTATQVYRDLQALSDDIMLDMFRLSKEHMSEAEDEMESQATTQAGSDDTESEDEEDEEILEQRQLEQAQRWQMAYYEITADQRKKSGELRTYNRRLARRIEEALPAPHGREFRLEYYRRTYSLAGYAFLQTNRVRSKVADLADLAPEQAGAIAEQLDAYDLLIDPQIEKLIGVIERRQTLQAENMFRFNDESMQEIWEEMSVIQEALQERTQEMFTQLRDTIGTEKTRQLLGDDAERWRWMIEQMDMQAQAEDAEDDQAESMDPNQDLDWPSDGMLPARLSVLELKQCAEALELDDAEYTVLEALRDDYSDVFRQIHDRDIAQIIQLEEMFWTWDEQTGEMLVNDNAERNVKRLTTLRRKALKAIMEAENEFFDQIELAIVNDDARREALDRVRLARQRTIYRQDQRAYTMYAYSHDGEEEEYEPPELAPLIRKQDWPDDTLASINPLLVDYERVLTDLLKTKYEIAMQQQESQQLMSIEYQRLTAQGADEDMTAYMDIQQKYMADTTTRSQAAVQAVKDCQETALDKLCAALPDERAAQLRDAHRRRAYAHVFNDDLVVLDQVSRARTLEDLSADQQRTLDQLALDYRNEYDDACNRLIDLYAASERMNFMNMQNLDETEQQTLMQSYMERQQLMQKIMFERTELNTRAIRQLKTALTPDQLRRIGDLPDPAQQNRNRF